MKTILGYGTDKSELLKRVLDAGCKPIGITVHLFEEMLIYETDEDAKEASQAVSPIGLHWSKEEFQRIENWRNRHYKDNFFGVPKIYWL